MGEVARAYAGCRQRIRELVERLDPAQASTTVPACPAWSVHDVVAHVSGVVDDALAGRLDGVATDPWTAAQVDARRGRAINDLLDEWDEQAPRFEELLDVIGDPGRQAVGDVVTHEHDLRGALGVPGARDSDALHIGFAFLVPRAVEVATKGGVALQVRATGGDVFGAAAPEVTLVADEFELARAFTGRRSVDQLRALNWEGDVERAITAFTWGPFRPSAIAIDE